MSSGGLGKVVLFDDRVVVGGGQVALAELVKSFAAASIEVTVSCPRELVIQLPAILSTAHTHVRLDADAVLDVLRPFTGTVALVANTYQTLPLALRVARKLRAQGRTAVTGGVLHSYPRNVLRRQIVRAVMSRVDYQLPVEPGLAKLCTRPQNLPILGLTEGQLGAAPTADPRRTGTVRAFARADPSKGLHLLPDVFRTVQTDGLLCEVAISPPQEEGNDSYVSSLTKNLAPWLVDGRRDPSWLNPGDVYVCSSIYGEAVSFSCQEAMARKCLVIAPALGAIPHLSPNGGVLLFPSGNGGAMIERLQDAMALSQEAFSRLCDQNRAASQALFNKWYAAVVQLIAVGEGRA
jgi:hypothetical protein